MDKYHYERQTEINYYSCGGNTIMLTSMIALLLHHLSKITNCWRIR